MLNYLLNNIYVEFDNKIYRQIIGIPMGCDCAPWLANLFLFTYEYNFISDRVSNEDSSVCQFKFTYRYIDDLCILNGPDDFISLDIYPVELILEKTNETHNQANFLDLNISIINKEFKVELYDKRKDYHFNVISMPNMLSNTPRNLTYGIFYSQLFRLCNCNSNLENFVSDVKDLISKLIYQNYDRTKLLWFVAKFIKKRHPCTMKYWSHLNLNMFK